MDMELLRFLRQDMEQKRIIFDTQATTNTTGLTENEKVLLDIQRAKAERAWFDAASAYKSAINDAVND